MPLWGLGEVACHIIFGRDIVLLIGSVKHPRGGGKSRLMVTLAHAPKDLLAVGVVSFGGRVIPTGKAKLLFCWLELERDGP